ncbi:MAG: hypothetical protein P4L33_19575 [Capsulimonadaceae bacterium]|nr:hypothetical protein [Capsulimonadaceae bacterium]
MGIRQYLRLAGICAALVASTSTLAWADPAAMFPFVADWDNAPAGSAIDVSALNAKPAGANGRIVVRDGHFVESRTGRRVKFLGVDFTGAADFPTHTDADKIALRLARMGVNIVRIHHHDSRSMRGAAALWERGTGPAKFSADGQERLDYLISQFKKQGIYVNLNLHVSRSYIPSDGFPDSVLQITTEFDKRVDNYDRRMIELQKQFAHDYLAHVNPYTGLSYVDDPCVAVVEINNENSLVSWGPERISFFDQLPEPFRGELIGPWNAWLKKKYGTDAALRKGWLPAAPANAQAGALLPAGANFPAWNLEDATKAAKATASTSPSAEGAADVRIDCPVKPDADWKVQAKLGGLNFVEGVAYILTFRAKADGDHPVSVYAGIEQADWHGNGLHRALDLKSDWQSYRMPFIALNVVPQHGRIVFSVGGATGTVWLSDVRLKEVAVDDVIPATQSLAAGNIDMPASGTAPAAADWTQFLVDAERAYADEMRAYLRKDLGVKACIVDTQMEYGGLSAFSREAGSDYADGHAYWQHPKFPGKPWDGANWLIGNSPMVNDLADGKTVTLHRLAFDRVAGKPFTVSEYNHPAPSDYQAEMMPFLASYAALQDWDMVYPFDYGRYDAAQPRDRIQSYFAIAQNPAKEAFYPLAALLLRADEIAPLASTTTLNIAPSAIEAAGDASREWTSANGGKPVDLLASRIQARVAPDAVASTLTVQTDKRASTSSVTVQRNSAGAVYVAQGRAAVTATGFVGGQTINMGPATITFPSFGNNFASLMLVSLDAKPLAVSSRLLLAITGKAENLDMVWNADRTSVSNHWGHGPVQAEGVPATLVIANTALRRVWALDSTGARTTEAPVTIKNGRATFDIAPSYHTVWYEIGR